MDHYFVLGVERTATIKEIEKAYKILARKFHPDKNGDTEKFQEIVAAYDVLRNHREEYDKKLESNFFHLVNLNFVPYAPKIVPVHIDLFNFCDQEIVAQIPHFFNREDKEIDPQQIIISCPFCKLQISCSVCESNKRLIKNNVFCRNVEETLKIPITKKDGIFNGSHRDMYTYILFFTIDTPPHIKLHKYDVYMNVHEPIAKFIKKNKLVVELFEKNEVELNVDLINLEKRIPGRGLYRNSVIRGDLILRTSTYV